MQSTSPLVRRLRHSALGTYTAYLAHGVRHPTLLRSRASATERASRLPGDPLIESPDWTTDFTMVIQASASDIWPWLVQMGYGRAGYYAWYRYDNGGVASADMIVPELQALAVGDVVPDGPRAREGFGVWRVVELLPDRALVLHSRREPWSGRELADRDPEACIDCSWAFVLSPIDDVRTRLHVRVRARFDHASARSKLLARLARLFFGLGDSVMENTMLDGIRERAERHGETTM
jgi:proline iminopeptidase